MKEKELRQQMIKNAKDAGYYKGLLEGFMCQATNMGEYYSVSTAVFEKVKNAVEALEAGKVN